MLPLRLPFTLPFRLPPPPPPPPPPEPIRPGPPPPSYRLKPGWWLLPAPPRPLLLLLLLFETRRSRSTLRPPALPPLSLRGLEAREECCVPPPALPAPAPSPPPPTPLPSTPPMPDTPAGPPLGYPCSECRCETSGALPSSRLLRRFREVGYQIRGSDDRKHVRSPVFFWPAFDKTDGHGTDFVASATYASPARRWEWQWEQQPASMVERQPARYATASLP